MSGKWRNLQIIFRKWKYIQTCGTCKLCLENGSIYKQYLEYVTYVLKMEVQKYTKIQV